MKALQSSEKSTRTFKSNLKTYLDIENQMQKSAAPSSSSNCTTLKIKRDDLSPAARCIRAAAAEETTHICLNGHASTATATTTRTTTTTIALSKLHTSTSTAVTLPIHNQLKVVAPPLPTAASSSSFIYETTTTSSSTAPLVSKMQCYDSSLTANARSRPVSRTSGLRIDYKNTDV